MNSKEQLVSIVIKKVWHEVVGGYDNALSDKILDSMPSNEDIIQEVYEEVIRTRFIAMRSGYLPIEKDIRFLGKIRILEMISEFHTANKDWK